MFISYEYVYKLVQDLQRLQNSKLLCLCLLE